MKIGEIIFNGNSKFSDKKLRSAMSDTKVKNPIRIFKASKFIKDIEAWVFESLNEDNSFVTEDGVVEDWGKTSSSYKEKIMIFSYFLLIR